MTTVFQSTQTLENLKPQALSELYPAFGISFKSQYYPELFANNLALESAQSQELLSQYGLEHQTALDDIAWLETHPENYMGNGGLSHYQLAQIREQYPVSLHGVGLSLGSAGNLSESHLQKLKQLSETYQPWMMSEHISWSMHPGDESSNRQAQFLNDLLPLPMTEETAAVLINHIKQTQDTLGRQILVENPSLYIDFKDADFDEPTLINHVLVESGAGLLLDINNIFVSSSNQHKNPIEYLNQIDISKVGEIHLAGHATIELSDGSPLLVDDHGSVVVNEVVELYQHFVKRYQREIQQTIPPTLIEWDTNPPPLSVLVEEIQKVKTALDDLDKNSSASESNKLLAN